LENKAMAYSNEILPQARGEAARVQADAKAYREKVVAEAEGETARFLAILDEYEKAPEVTRERLYLETMEQVLGETNMVLLDVKEGSSLMYLPLDQLVKSKGARGQSWDRQSSTPRVDQKPATEPEREVVRERRSRR
jgi:membrane protease subunit HflK